MKKEYALFLQAISAALKNKNVDWDLEISREEWEALFRLAEAHRMLPMVYQAVYSCPAARKADRELMLRYRMYSMQMVVLQTRKTAEFLPILRALQEAGVEPLVVKGITCRQLYPNPDHRLSSDEDVLIPPEKFEACLPVLAQFGYGTDNPQNTSYEVLFLRPNGPLSLEIHRSLFPEQNTAYGDLNRFFADVHSRAVELDGIPTLSPTDHMLYLLCHAFKHFLHSGFGMRQVCDLILYANHYGKQIDWGFILEKCRQIRAEQFAAGLFRIGWNYLGFSLEKSRYPLQWQAILVNETMLLDDILRSGVYGSADEDRLHSSNLTLHAVSAQKQGRSSAGSLLKTVFPTAKDLEGRYPYLREKPMLLPIAWTERLIKYNKGNATAADTVRIGNDRIELMKRYGILDK